MAGETQKNDRQLLINSRYSQPRCTSALHFAVS